MAQSAKEFVDLLALDGRRYMTATLDRILSVVYDFSASVWQFPQLYRFVDHGIGHSFRITKIALELLEILRPPTESLSDIERLVLGIASLTHDVGMQYPKYPRLGVQLEHDDVRKQHTSLGFEMIQEALAGKPNERGLPPLPNDQLQVFFVELGARVGYAHSGTDYWVKLASATYARHVEGGEQVLRPRLLAAALRLADELHCEYTRLPDLDWLSSSDLPEEAKCHWVACYYARSLDIRSPGPGAARIQMHWRIPEGASDDEQDLIRSLLEEFRERKISREIRLVTDDYFRWGDAMETPLIAFTLDSAAERVPGILHVPAVVAQYVRTQFRPYQFQIKPTPQYKRVREILDDSSLEPVKNAARVFVTGGSGAESIHVRLKTGWHTNKYIRCREALFRCSVRRLSLFMFAQVVFQRVR